MRIVELRAENIKRLRAVEIRPDEDGNLVIVGGRNRAGKSSVLDSIMYALAGKASIPDMPIRKGQRKAQVEVDLGDFLVTRTFTVGGGSQLKITDASGEKVNSPQKLLDRLVGRLAFDPLAFSRLDAKAQLAALRDVVGIDFSKVDMERQLAFERRTELNRELRALRSGLDQMPEHADIPSEPIDVSEGLEELQRAGRLNAIAVSEGEELGRTSEKVDECRKEVRRIERMLRNAKRDLGDAEGRQEGQRRTAERAAAKVVDLRPIQEKLRNADAVNTRIRENAERARVAAEVDRVEQLVREKTELIEAIDRNKRESMEHAEFPIEGLGFDDDGVTLNGLPFEQASQAEQLGVSAAMGLAVNPELRVLLIRDGSLLDFDSLIFLEEFAAGHDAQIWLERVSNGDEVSVLIEEGEVVENISGRGGGA